MEQIKHFPKILTTKKDKGFEGIAGVRLESILEGNLILSQLGFSEERSSHSNALDPKKQQQAREELLYAISSWPQSVSLELHLTSIPDLLHRAQGRLLITLFIRCFASTKDKAKEEIAHHYLSLMPILAAYLPEAEFIPITNEKELDKRRTPFKPAYALAIHRRQEELSLSTPLKALSMGFTSMMQRDGEDNNVVEHLFPWVPSLNDWSRLTDTLMAQLDPVQIIIRLRPGVKNDNAIDRLNQTIQTCELSLSGIKEYQITLNRQVSLIRDMSLKQLLSLRDQCFNLGVFILASHPIDTSLGNILGKVITGPRLTTDENILFQGGFTSTKIMVQHALNSDYFLGNEPFTPSEAACAFRLPSPQIEEHPGLPVKRFRTSLAFIPSVSHKGNDSIELFINEHRGMTQPIRMNADDRMRHTFIIGQTGTGKSTLMENMILQDIRAGKGLAVIDPHGELVEAILGKIPPERVEDVVLFDLLDRQKPLGFNLIQWSTQEERDIIIDELFLTLDRIYDMKIAGGPVFETNFRGMLKLLMGEKLREDFIPTLLEFTSCYLNRGFRHWLKGHIKDPQTLDFVEELERTKGETSLENLSSYITSKFSRFTYDSTLKRIVGQEKTSFDFDEIMNKGKVFLVKLGKGRFGANVSALLANQIMARFKLAAMKRGDMRPKDRRDFFLYLDECHNLPSENIVELLSEARKFRMGLILATQYTAQLAEEDNKGSNLLSAILGNVGTTLIFRLGYEDALRLSPTLRPYFTSLDIIGLPNWHGYSRLQKGQESIPAFSFRTYKDKSLFSEELSDHIRNMSRLKYGTDQNVVDAQIQHRRSSWKKDENGD